MKIEQKEFKKFNPITLTLETEEEALILVAICGSISGCPNGPRSVSDKIYELFGKLGIRNRDENFIERYEVRGSLNITKKGK